MESKARLLVGQSLSVDAPCTIVFSDLDNFAVGPNLSVAAAELVITGTGAAVVLGQTALSDDHRVTVIEED